MKYLIIILLLAACWQAPQKDVQLSAETKFIINNPKLANDTPAVRRPWSGMVKLRDTVPAVRPKDDFTANGQLGLEFQYNSDTLNWVLAVNVDGSVYVQGDTIKVIKKLVEYMRENLNRETGVQDALDAAVDFTNTVGSEYKKGKQWEAYQRELKKQGYTVIKLPKKISEKQ